jgi:hypothetical protein
MSITRPMSRVGPHGFALFLSTDADYPLLDIDGTPTQLNHLVRALNARLGCAGVAYALDLPAEIIPTSVPAVGIPQAISLHVSDCLGNVLPFRGQREVDRKDAALPRHVTDVDVTGVRSHRLPRDREPETETRAIGTASVPEGLKQIAFLLWNAAALVVDLDEQTSGVRMCPQGHRTSCGGVLERVLQHVHHRRCEELGIGVNGQFGVDGQYREKNPAVL